MSLYHLTNFEIWEYYQKEPKFNGFYTRTNLPEIKNEIEYKRMIQ